MRRSIPYAKTFYAIVLSTLLSLQVLPLSVKAQRHAEPTSDVREDFGPEVPKSKIAPDLDESIEMAPFSQSSEELHQVIIQLKEAPRQLSTSALSYVMGEKLAPLEGRFKKAYKRLGLVSAELPLSRIRELEADEDIAYISPDRSTKALGHATEVTGANDARNYTTNTAGRKVLGASIGIAILDSGIDPNHELTKVATDHSGVIYSKDFTGQNTTEDKYGHGTHVATLSAGRGDVATAAYQGVASGAWLINLRVLNDSGTGTSSQAIAAIDWCITNKAPYNIRIINMSLGAVAKDSYRTDPLCLAARRAHDAGIVIVCASGNNGKDTLGKKVYGGIHSPGIDPSVITVGAVNTFGTASRGDDKVASYSSRGPTRGYTTDSLGVRHYDNLIKPDLVAPGNKLLGACSTSSQSNSSSLFKKNPSLNPGNASSTAKQMMYLSGTSMSAALVSGAAAMLFEVNPTLTPNLVKAILMYTAQPIEGANNFEQGAGLLNVEGAVRMAQSIIYSAYQLGNGQSMLAGSMPTQNDTIAGSTVNWGQGIITDYTFVYGSNLMKYWQGMYANNVVLADATSVVNGNLARNSSLTSSGVLLADGVLLCDGTLLADGTLLTDGVLLADGTLLTDGTLLADGGAIKADSTVYANSTPTGEGTSKMSYVAIP